MLGGVFGYVDRFTLQHGNADLGAFALVGMGAVFAGIIRAPITSVLIIFEMTGSYGLILPLMISNMTAFALARHFRPVPIYEALLHQDRIYLPHRGARVSHALEQLRVGHTMVRDPVTIDASTSISEALRQVENDDFSTYPVVENGHAFVGFVTEARLRRTAAEGGRELSVATVVQAAPRTEPGDTLVHAVVMMEKSRARQLGVIDPHDGKRLIGLLTMSDIIRAHARAAMDATDSDRTE